MKIVFLDVDGVLNTMDSLGEAEDDSDFLFDKKSGSPLEKRCLNNLIQILLKTGAKIVVTSTWRMFPDKMQFLTRTVDEMFDHAVAWQNAENAETEKLNKTPVFIGITTDAGAPPFGGGRGQEVRLWLEGHPECERFVVLDDDHKQSFQDALFGEEKLPHGVEGMLIETKLGGYLDPLPFIEQGLTGEHVDTAVQFLNNSQ